MLRIAICDDDKYISSYIEEFALSECLAKGLRTSIDVFSDGIHLLESIQQNEAYDIIFLDIEMEQLDGISTARKIREVDLSVLLIYVSGYDEYLKELFEVEPFRFISKPIDRNRLKTYFSDAIQRTLEKELFFQYSFNKEIQKIPLDDIVYFESKNRSIYIYLKDGTSRYFYGKLNDIEKKLNECRQIFLRIHQSYYVNYNYVTKMNFSFLTIHYHDYDINLKISEDRQKSVRSLLIDAAGKRFST